jgi:hypothetical protein
MLRFSKNPERGQCAFADAWQMRLELRWRRAAAAPDLVQLRRESLRWLREGGAGSTEEFQHGGWLGARGVAHGQAFLNCSRWFPEAGLLLELFLWRPEGEEELLDHCQPVEKADRGRWRAFGLDVRTDLPLRRCEALPAFTRLVFADKERDAEAGGLPDNRLVVERRGMAASWLAPGATVEDWNRPHIPRKLRRESVFLDGPCHAEIASRPLKAWERLWARLRALAARRPFHPGYLVSVACAVPERNEVRRAEVLTWEETVPTAKAASQLRWEGGPPCLPETFSAPVLTPDAECSLPAPESWAAFLQARPLRNVAAEVEPSGAGLYLKIPNIKPAWYRPPLSWFIPWRPHRRVALDGLGAAIWERCDGETRILDLVREFAAEHQTSFHEARTDITHYLRTLTERGLLAMAS